MPNLRIDPVTGRFVIVAANRAARPNEFRSSSNDGPAETSCPFCPGNESETPPAVATYPRTPSAAEPSNWLLRVVPNRYPALGDGRKDELPSEGLLRQFPGVGVHEVLIESPRHVRSISDQTEDEVSLVFVAYRDRMRTLCQTGGLRSVLIFKNAGAAAGASIEHTHSQLMGLPNVPHEIQHELDTADRYFRGNHECLFCAMIRHEDQGGTRIVATTPNLVAFCPFSSRNAYETWILPREHASHFECTHDQHLSELARLARFCVGRIETVARCPAYNYLIHSTPFDTPDVPHYHWHLEIIPRTAMIGGFEWGTGCYINTVPPEDAAALLRETDSTPDGRK